MTDEKQDPIWPRSIFAAEREGDNDGMHVFDVVATVPRYAGDTERECYFKEYVDISIFESQAKYHAARIATATAERDALQAQLAAQVVTVKPLVWYGKPNAQHQRIGRAGAVAYSVSFAMGHWGYTKGNQSGHTVSAIGGAFFNSEYDAISGADDDHERFILNAITTRPASEVRLEALQEAAKICEDQVRGARDNNCPQEALGAQWSGRAILELIERESPTAIDAPKGGDA